MKRSNTIFIFLYIFLLLYQPPIFSTNVIHFLFLIAIVYLLKNKRNNIIVLPANYKFFLKTNLLFFVFASILDFVNGAYLNIYTLFLYIIELQVCVIFLVCYGKKYKYNILELSICGGVFEAIIALMSFLVPWIQDKIISLCIFNGYPVETAWFAGKRFFGLSSQLTFTMPVIQIVLAIIVIEKLVTNKKDNKIVLMLESILLVFSAIINARISIVIFFTGVLYLVIKYHTKIRLKHYIAFIAGTTIILFLIFIFSSKTFYWIYDGIKEILLLFTGKSDDGYFSTLFNEFIFFPNSIKGFLLGEGIFVFNTPIDGMRSDVGFIIDFWMYGLIGIIMKYSGFVVSLLKDKKDTLFAIFLLVVCAFCNIKGPVFETNELIAFVSLYSCINQKNIMEEK